MGAAHAARPAPYALIQTPPVPRRPAAPRAQASRPRRQLCPGLTQTA